GLYRGGTRRSHRFSAGDGAAGGAAGIGGSRGDDALAGGRACLKSGGGRGGAAMVSVQGRVNSATFARISGFWRIYSKEADRNRRYLERFEFTFLPWVAGFALLYLPPFFTPAPSPLSPGRALPLSGS